MIDYEDWVARRPPQSRRECSVAAEAVLLARMVVESHRSPLKGATYHGDLDGALHRLEQVYHKRADALPETPLSLVGWSPGKAEGG